MTTVRRREWKTKDGRKRTGHFVDWRDENGERHGKLFTGQNTKARADAKKLEIENAKAQGKSTAAVAASLPGGAVVTIRQAGERWVRGVEAAGREKSTWKAYERQLAQHVYPTLIDLPNEGGRVAFGDLPIREVTAPHCELFKKVLIKTLKPKYARRILTVVKMVFNDCALVGDVAANPALPVKVEKVKRGEDKIIIPPKGELARIIAAARTAQPSPVTLAEAWVTTTLFSGLRPSENRGAAIEDLVLEGRAPGIRVCRRADQWRVIGNVKTETAKRFVPLPPEAIAVLRRWLLVVPRGEGFIDPETKQTLHLLFPTGIGTVLALSHVHNYLWVPVLERAGLVTWGVRKDKFGRPKLDEGGKPIPCPNPRYPVNVLRHLCASLKIEQGIDPKRLQYEMGHSSIQVTYDIYGHLFRERDGDGAIVGKIARELLR